MNGAEKGQFPCRNPPFPPLFKLPSGLSFAPQVLQVLTEVLRNRPSVAPRIVSFACPKLTYAPARGLVEKRAMGMLKSLSATTGFGFITCPELREAFGQDVFLHVKQITAYQGLLMPGTGDGKGHRKTRY